MLSSLIIHFCSVWFNSSFSSSFTPFFSFRLICNEVKNEINRMEKKKAFILHQILGVHSNSLLFNWLFGLFVFGFCSLINNPKIPIKTSEKKQHSTIHVFHLSSFIQLKVCSFSFTYFNWMKWMRDRSVNWLCALVSFIYFIPLCFILIERSETNKANGMEMNEKKTKNHSSPLALGSCRMVWVLLVLCLSFNQSETVSEWKECTRFVWLKRKEKHKRTNLNFQDSCVSLC